MKKILFVLIMSVFAMANAFAQEVKYVSGTDADFMKRAQTFVEQTKAVCDNYSDEEWSLSLKEFDKLDDEFDEIEDKISDENQKEFRRLKGVYAGLFAKAAPKMIGSKAKNIYEHNILPFLEGVYETIK